MKLVIENIRSFVGRHEIPIRPLTILVGENSSGKSTCLAALAAASDKDVFPKLSAFNRAPFDLGAFEAIASYKGGKAGRAKEFSLGYTVAKGNEDITVNATYCRSEEGEPRVTAMKLTIAGSEISLSWESTIIRVRAQGFDAGETIDTHIPNTASRSTSAGMSALMTYIPSAAIMPRAGGVDMDILNRFIEFAATITSSAPTAKSVAPIRSEPKRTYDRLADEYDPSGDHVPFILARLLRTESRRGKILGEALRRFGAESGLFKKIVVKQLGSKTGDPFQVQVDVGGPSVNLSDVGYGVSQSLPIIVESIQSEANTTVLLQQPEVHLHPRAQAALGSFFAHLVQDGGKQFVIETHSDYLLDRVRQEVAAGTLSPKSVNILFFERPHIETKVTELTLDEAGNICNAPSSYREFFLEEELRILTRATQG